MENFNVGDVVRLKSGSPRMTIKKLYDGTCECQWFAGSKLQDGLFNFDTLVLVTDEAEEE